MPAADPVERRVNASIAANARWARVKNRAAETEAARAAAPNGIDYFLRQIDPDCQMPDADRLKAAENARREYYQRLGKAGRRAKRTRRPT